MPSLHETLMGRKLIEVTLPNIGEELRRIADSLDEKQIRTENGIKNLITQFPNDEELGNEIRKRWKK